VQAAGVVARRLTVVRQLVLRPFVIDHVQQMRLSGERKVDGGSHLVRFPTARQARSSRSDWIQVRNPPCDVGWKVHNGTSFLISTQPRNKIAPPNSPITPRRT
jgi:hypothetical protein